MRLGPVPCQGCREPVVWTGHRWRSVGQRGKGRHVCAVGRCGAWMPQARERCARRPGHGYEHRTAYALANARRRYTVGDGVSITPTHETARLPLTPVAAGSSHPSWSQHA